MHSLFITLAKSGMSPLSMPTFWTQIQRTVQPVTANSQKQQITISTYDFVLNTEAETNIFQTDGQRLKSQQIGNTTTTGSKKHVTNVHKNMYSVFTAIIANVL